MNDEINVCFQNHSMYVRVAYKYLKSLEDAEDCVQVTRQLTDTEEKHRQRWFMTPKK